MQIPGFIRGKANQGNKVAQAFIQMYDNGDKSPYDPEAYAALKSQMGGGDDDEYEADAPRQEDFESPMSPEEKKANKAIENYGDKYKNKSIYDLDKMGFEGSHNHVISALRNSAYDTPEEALKAMDRWDLDENQKAYTKEYIKAVFGLDDGEYENDLDVPSKEDAFDRSQKPVGKDNNDTIEGIRSDIFAADTKEEFYKATSKIDEALEAGEIDEETADKLYKEADAAIDEKLGNKSQDNKKSEENPLNAKLKEFGYSDEEISKLSKEDLDLAKDFFSRFNNPKPRR